MTKTRLFRKKIEDKIMKIKVGKKKLRLGMTKIKAQMVGAFTHPGP